jgi:hypothetical protein
MLRVIIITGYAGAAVLLGCTLFLRVRLIPHKQALIGSQPSSAASFCFLAGMLLLGLASLLRLITLSTHPK